MRITRLRFAFYLLIIALPLTATALRFSHYISKSSFLLFYGVAWRLA